MKSKTSFLGILCAVLAALSSCLNDDYNYTYYSDTAITAFTLGTVNIEYHTTASDGSDSTYTSTYTGSQNEVYIDQLNSRIYNVDSLPVGSDLSAVLVTISTLNYGTVVIKNLTDTLWTYYSSSDSIDLSEDRTMRVLSSDGTCYKDYIVSITAHEEDEDSFTWYTMPSNDMIAQMTQMRAVTTGNQLYVYGTLTDGSHKLLTSADAESWSEMALPTQDGLDSAMVATDGSRLMMLAAGYVYVTEDGSSWISSVPDVALKVLAGGNETEVYGITYDDRFAVSTDHGVTWTEDAVEESEWYDNSGFMPQHDYNVITRTSWTNDDVQRVAMIGRRDDYAANDSTTAVIWAKTLDPDEDNVWYYTPFMVYGYRHYELPTLYNISAANYGDGIMATGATAEDGGYETIYYSPDMAVTWKVPDGLTIPDDFQSMTTAQLVADENGFFYLIGADSANNSCKIYRCKLNQMTWE